MSALGVDVVCQELSDSIVAFVNDGGIIINDLVMAPRMMCSPRAFGLSNSCPLACVLYTFSQRTHLYFTNSFYCY